MALLMALISGADRWRWMAGLIDVDGLAGLMAGGADGRRTGRAGFHQEKAPTGFGRG